MALTLALQAAATWPAHGALNVYIRNPQSRMLVMLRGWWSAFALVLIVYLRAPK